MTSSDRRLTLTLGFALSNLSPAQLWCYYLAVGGSGSREEVLDYARGLQEPDDYEHNLVAQALNEFLMEKGLSPLIEYRDIPPTGH